MAKDEKRKTSAGDEDAGNRKPKRGKAREESAQQNKHDSVEKVEEAPEIEFGGKAIEQIVKKSSSDTLTAFSTHVGGGTLTVVVATKVKRDSKNNVQGEYLDYIPPCFYWFTFADFNHLRLLYLSNRHGAQSWKL